MDQHIEYAEAGTRTYAKEVIIPAPTPWPLLLAFGLMLVFGAFILQPGFAYLGLLVVVAAAIGWWRVVISSEAHESVPLDAKHRPSPVKVKSAAVARLKIGDAKHRMRIPVEVHPYTAGVAGGLAGGLIMAVLACLYGLVAQHSVWYPVNLLAGVLLPDIGNASVEQLRQFNGAAFLAALAGHVALSILVGVLYAVILPMFPKRAFLWAGILMPIIWSAIVATLLNLLNPALNERISWPWFVVCQFAYCLICGGYIARSSKIGTMQSWTFAERAHMEAPGLEQKTDDQQ